MGHLFNFRGPSGGISLIGGIKREMCLFSKLWWPTTVTAKPKTSWQNRKSHGKNKIPHDKTKNLTTKPKTSR